MGHYKSDTVPVRKAGPHKGHWENIPSTDAPREDYNRYPTLQSAVANAQRLSAGEAIPQQPAQPAQSRALSEALFRRLVEMGKIAPGER